MFPDNPEYQCQGIDLIINDLYTDEIKIDTYESGNFFLETIANVRKNKPGCIISSQADYLLFFILWSYRYF